MVYLLDITSEEWLRIEAAKQLGINVDTFLKGAIASLPTEAQNGRDLSQERGNMDRSLPMPQLHVTKPITLPEYTDEKRQAAVAFFLEQSQKPLIDANEIQKADADFEELMQNLREWR